MRRFAFVAALAAVLVAAFAAADGAPPKGGQGIELRRADGVIAITDGLAPYHGPSGSSGADNSGWYLIRITNTAVRPAIRVLQAAQPPSVACASFPFRRVRASCTSPAPIPAW